MVHKTGFPDREKKGTIVFSSADHSKKKRKKYEEIPSVHHQRGKRTRVVIQQTDWMNDLWPMTGTVGANIPTTFWVVDLV